MWSGGFTIDRVESFHINLRDKSGRSIFIRVEVSLFAATFCSVLSDATNFPPPFRIDNFSEVPVTCHQSGVTDENFKTVVKAHQSVPYAWDEPSLPPHLTCCAPGGILHILTNLFTTLFFLFFPSAVCLHFFHYITTRFLCNLQHECRWRRLSIDL